MIDYTIRFDMSKLSPAQIKILAQAQKNRKKPRKTVRAPHENDNKSWHELFDFGKDHTNAN
jgi:hypothetical protein